MKYISLISEISQINQAAKSQAVKAVNKMFKKRDVLRKLPQESMISISSKDLLKDVFVK